MADIGSHDEIDLIKGLGNFDRQRMGPRPERGSGKPEDGLLAGCARVKCWAGSEVTDKRELLVGCDGKVYCHVVAFVRVPAQIGNGGEAPPRDPR